MGRGVPSLSRPPRNTSCGGTSWWSCCCSSWWLWRRPRRSPAKERSQERSRAKKPSKPSKPKCPADSINKAKFMKYTVTTGKGKNAKPVADQPCWLDLKRNDCAKCKPGGVQCGAPMEKWCQSKKSKTGCPGIPQFKYTRSSTGFPCYWDPKSFECAWCVSNMVQCKDGSTSDWATNPSGEVEMTIEADSKFWVYPQGSDLFPTL